MVIDLKMSFRGLWATILLSLCILSLHVHAQEQSKPSPNEALTLNLQNADIGALIETVSYVTGKNFIVDPRVTAKVTVVSAIPTEPERLYDLFLSILKVHGYAAVDQGTAIKIVPDVNAKQESVPTLINGVTSQSDQVSTLVVELQNVSANELIPIIRPLLPQSAHLAAHENILIAADSASNLNRLTKIIKRIDRESNVAFEVIQLQYANAADIVQLISPTLRTITAGDPKKGAAAANSNSIVADERTNSILLVAERKQRLEIRALISHLDTPVNSQNNAEVIYLKYAVASELVPILEGIGSKLEVDNGNTPGAAGGAPAANANNARRSANRGGNQEPIFDIEADDNVNALIIHAEPRRMAALKSIIKQLDIRRAQVLVEGIIAEVSYNKSLGLGIQWQTSATSDGAFGALNSTGADSVTGFGNTLAGVGGLTLGYFSGGSLRGLLRAIADDSFSNILSTPTLTTLDNEEAEITVGQNVPFITGQFTTNTNNNNPFQTIERQDVGILLKVKPQINEGDSVRLEIEQEISQVVDETNPAGIITSKNKVTTNVLVDDQQIVVLGGLLQDTVNESQSKVPVLGDVPIVGNLFRNTTDRHDKTNLMIFLRPQIIRDTRTGSQLSNKKYDFIRKEQQQLKDQGVTLMSDDVIQELPEFEITNKTDENFIRSYSAPKPQEDPNEIKQSLSKSGLLK